MKIELNAAQIAHLRIVLRRGLKGLPLSAMAFAALKFLNRAEDDAIARELQEFAPKADAGDIRGQSQGDYFPFIVVGQEQRSGVAYYVMDQASVRVSCYYDRAADAERRARQMKNNAVVS